MRCMKCGREIKEPQVFCENCLAEMEKHPVKPNAQVLLPVRTEAPAIKKKNRKQRDAKPEELLRQQRGLIRLLCVALAITVIAFVLAAIMLLRLLEQKDFSPDQGFRIVTEK